MEENILKDFETFNEFPDKYIKVNSNSDYYFIRKLREDFVAKINIDSITIIKVLGENKIMNKKSYYDINNGNLVFTTKSISNIDGSNEEFIQNKEIVEIISLSNILNIKGNNTYYLSKEDIETLVNYKEENAKTYNLKPKKYYY